MATDFIQEKKKQRYLSVILIIIFLVMGIVAWQGFLKEKVVPPVEQTPSIYQEVEINFGALEDVILKELQVFTEAPSFTGEAGRENPFVPY